MKLFFVAVTVGAILLCAPFDTYFTTSLVRVAEHFSARLEGAPPAKRLVIFLADGLRADKCLELDEKQSPRMPFLSSCDSVVTILHFNCTARLSYLRKRPVDAYMAERSCLLPDATITWLCRTVIQEKGVWGLSFGRAPTETRPSHITIIAGIHEDPSGILKGWKENPVPFDSVFNRSIHTWCWGNTDILQLFLRGIADGRATIRGYGKDFEKSSEFYPYRLDTWVFSDVEGFFKTAQSNTALESALRQDGIILYLHLLGVDTAGHIFSAGSSVYQHNIKVIDQGIQSVVSLISEFYKDERTAYLMTSDHGMTLEGSHGSDLPEETITPFIAWGAGLRGPVRASVTTTAVHHGQKTACNDNVACTSRTPIDVTPWNLSDYERHDIEQADIAPLVSTLLGLAVPANSMGRLHAGLLNMSEHDRTASVLANAQQIVEQLKVQEKRVRRHTLSSLFAWTYGNMAIGDVGALLNKASDALMQADYSTSRRLSTDIMEAAQAGLRYYSAYDQPFLRFCVALSFIGLMAYSLTTLMEIDGDTKMQPEVQRQQAAIVCCPRGAWFWSRFRMSAFIIIQLVILALLTAQKAPLLYYLYALLPIWLWKSVLERILDKRGRLVNLLTYQLKAVLLTIFFTALGVVFLVCSFYRRETAAGLLLTLGSMPWWRRTAAARGSPQLPRRVQLIWCVTCCLLACFPVMPMAKRNTNYSLVILAACCVSATTYWKARVFSCRILKLQAVLAVLTGAVVFWTSLKVTGGQDAPLVSRVFCWFLLGTTPLIPLMTSARSAEHRLGSLTASLTTLYITFSFSHEAVFLVVLSALMSAWHRVESGLVSNSAESANDPENHRRSCISPDSACRPPLSPDSDDFRLAILFMYLLAAAFFATNDVASVHNVDQKSVKCYLTAFVAGITHCLVLIKVATPPLLVACTFGVLVRDTQGASRNCQSWFAKFLAMTSIMSLYFFYHITSEGSWLNMGLSLSRYVTAVILPFAMSVYVQLGLFLSTASLGS